jgi:DNA-binding CsgD family transcriptional regulator
MRGGTTTGADFREAARHEHELNERQREVLALVASGLTNAEIGERLGMTLDGAKWNVSEILTKLGLESREHAAEYWRWRHGSVWSRVRGWLGAPLLKVAGAGAATVLVVGVVAALSSEDEPPPVDEPGRPFYLEAEVFVRDNARTVGTNIAGEAGPAEELDETRSMIRWWWRDADHSRFELETRGSAIGETAFFSVADGNSQWYYNETDKIYYQLELEPLPEGYSTRGIPASLFMGPLPVAGDVDTIDEVAAWFGSWAEGASRGEVVREERILGRRVSVIALSPASCSSTQRVNPDGTSSSEEKCSGTSELWVDPETMLALKWVSNTDGDFRQQVEAVVTRLDYDTQIDDERFTFEPPPGATKRIEDPTHLSSGSQLAGEPPAGFLRLGHEPRAYELTGESQGLAPGSEGPVIYEAEYGSPGDAVFTVSQRKRAMPESLKVGEEHEARGLTRYSTTLENGWTRVAWEEAGVTVVLEAESMPIEQLLAIAGSMEVVE